MLNKNTTCSLCSGIADIHSSGSDDPAFENVIIQTKDKEGIAVELTGRFARFPLDSTRPEIGYDLDVTMEAVTTALMGECLGVNLPIEGPLQVKFRIEGDTKSLKLNKNGFQVGAKGSLLFGDWSLLDPLQNIELHIQVNSPDTQSLSVAINQQLPELVKLTAQAHLHTVSGKHWLTQSVDRFRKRHRPENRQ